MNIRRLGTIIKYPVFFSFLLICLNCNLIAQQEEYIIPDKEYSKAKIYKTNYNIIRGTSLKLINDTILSYTNTQTQNSEVLSIDNVKYITVKKGTKALDYGLIGAGIGLVSVALTQALNANNPFIDGDSWGLMYAGFTIGGGALGAIIGSFSTKWRRIYIQKKETSVSFLIQPEYNRYNYCSNIGLIVNIKF